MSYYVWLQMVLRCFYFQSDALERFPQALLERKVYWRSEPSNQVIMVRVRNRERWHHPCGGKVGAPHFFRNNVIQVNTVINNLSTVCFIFNGFNSDGIFMTQDVRIVLYILLVMLRNPVKLWRKIANSKPKRISDWRPVWLNGKQVLGIHFTSRVALTTVRMSHNKGVPKFRVDTDGETENTTTLSAYYQKKCSCCLY